MRIGVLGMQGAVQPHIEKLSKLGVTTEIVTQAYHLKNLSGILLPGGESTAMIHLLKDSGMWEDLQHFVKQKPTFGFCAGAILLANTVDNAVQESFKALDISISRNAYGRQASSFIDEIVGEGPFSGKKIEGVFIRAPKIKSWGADVDVCFKQGQEVVMVAQGKTWAATFHPELSQDDFLHSAFIEMCQKYG